MVDKMKIQDRLLVELKTSTPEKVRKKVGDILFQKEGFHYLYEEGIIQYLIPELSDLESYQHNPKYHPEGSLYNHYCVAFDTYYDSKDKTELGAWALLFHDVAKTVVADWKPEVGYHSYIMHEKVGSELFKDKYRDGIISFSEEEADAIEWVIKEHNNFCRVAKEKKSLALIHHPDFKLLCEVAQADAMRVNRDFYLSRIEYFSMMKSKFPEMPDYS